MLNHRKLDATKAYYRVGENRRREAVDRVAAMQFDRHGSRLWRTAQQLLDSEHTRRAIGEVAVPFGVCAEPSNVKAGGNACPFRFRCAGWDHFRTDISYLPDLQAYLDEWARSEAMPSEEEITRVRRFIARVHAGLDDLTDDERAQVEDAVATVRRHRTVMIGMPRIRQVVPDLRSERTALTDTSARSTAMAQGRRADSARRRQRVLKALNDAINNGDEISVSGIARHARAANREDSVTGVAGIALWGELLAPDPMATVRPPR